MNNKHLTIYVWLVIVLASLFVSGAVLASEEPVRARPPSISNNSARESVPGQVGPQAILWDQTGVGVPAGDNDSSSSYTGSSSQYNRQIADDFVISEPVNTYWLINSVEVIGVAGGGVGTSATLQFYKDAITNTVSITTTYHLPGASVYNSPVSASLTASTVVITLPTTLVLGSGTYWMSVQANLGSNAGDNWYWTERNNASPYTGTQPSVFKGKGGSDGCQTVWKPRRTFCWIGINPDMQFRLKGIKVTFSDFIRLPLIMR